MTIVIAAEEHVCSAYSASGHGRSTHRRCRCTLYSKYIRRACWMAWSLRRVRMSDWCWTSSRTEVCRNGFQIMSLVAKLWIEPTVYVLLRHFGHVDASLQAYGNHVRVCAALSEPLCRVSHTVRAVLFGRQATGNNFLHTLFWFKVQKTLPNLNALRGSSRVTLAKPAKHCRVHVFFLQHPCPMSPTFLRPRPRPPPPIAVSHLTPAARHASQAQAHRRRRVAVRHPTVRLLPPR